MTETLLLAFIMSVCPHTPIEDAQECSDKYVNCAITEKGYVSQKDFSRCLEK